MKRILTAVALVLTLAWIGFIFSNSLDTGVESGAKSSSVHRIVNEVAQSLGATEEIPESTIRTSAHFLEFAVLGTLLSADIMLLASLFPSAPLSKRHAYFSLALPSSILLAVVDETIQRFSPGRAMQFIDVLIDSGGALCGMLVFAAVYFAIYAHRIRKRHPAISTT